MKNSRTGEEHMKTDAEEWQLIDMSRFSLS